MPIEFLNDVKILKLETFTKTEKIKVKNETDKQKVLSKQGIAYIPRQGNATLDGIVNMEIPVELWEFAFEYVLDNYFFEFENKTQRGFPNQFRIIKPSKIETHEEFKDWFKDYAIIRKKHNIKTKLNEKTFNTDMSYKVAAVVGELLCYLLWHNNIEEYNLFNGVTEYDFKAFGKKVDVKTKYRVNTEVSYYYQATIPKYQVDNLFCDAYVFINVSNVKSAQIIGIIEKNYLTQNAILYPKGTPQWNNKKHYKIDTYSMDYDEIPNWSKAKDILGLLPTRYP